MARILQIACWVIATWLLSTAQVLLRAQEQQPAAVQPIELITDPQPVRKAPAPTSLTVIGIVDGGGIDRYGTAIFRRGDWLLENINWVDRAGADAISLLLAGRRLSVGHRLDLFLLAGPWYEYANRAWDEIVIDTNFQFHSERFRLASVNHWGIPTKVTGEFFDSHIATVSGMRGLPHWLGATGQIECSHAGVETSWAGPMLIKKKADVSVTGAPYWDFHHQRGGVRLTISYGLSLLAKRRQNDSQR